MVGDLVESKFAEFWQVYPRKTNRKKAEVSFGRLTKEQQAKCVLGAAYQALHNPQWKNPSLIPHATTFIHGARWEDDVVENKNGTDRVQETQTDSPVDMVWSALAQMFPLNFVSKYGEKPLPVWRTQLKDIPMKRLQRGLRLALESKSEWPPSLPTFISYCAQRLEEIYPPALPRAIKTDVPTALKHIEEMKQILTGCGKIS
jgi:hypothetical protein